MAQYAPMYDSFHRTAQDRYVPTARMSVSASVYLPGSDLDMYTGELKPDRQRRCRTQAKRIEHELLEKEREKRAASVKREMEKGGVRITVCMGVLITAVLLFVCGITILYQHGRIADCQKEINRIERSLKELRTQNNDLRAQINEASDASVICYAAAQELNMIPSEAVEAIHLVAVDTRPRDAAKRQAMYAQQQAQPPSTPVPAIASN